MSNMSEVKDDSETDVESIPDCRNSSKSSPHTNWSDSSNTNKPYSNKSSYVYTPNELSDDAQEEIEDWDEVNQLYLKKLEEYKSNEDSDEEIRNYCRLVHSAPLTLPKSNHICTLNAIDENEEFVIDDDSLEKENEVTSIETDDEERQIVTPRQKEVPPKRRCVRVLTPVISKEESEEVEVFFPNQRVNIGEKTYIVRRVARKEKRSICTQVEDGEETEEIDDKDGDVEEGFNEIEMDFDDGKEIRGNNDKIEHDFNKEEINKVEIDKEEIDKEEINEEVGIEEINREINTVVEDDIQITSKMTFEKTNEPLQVINLPHSVEDGIKSNVTLEPNIIILDDKSPQGEPCNSPMGDAPFYKENYSSKVRNDVLLKKKQKRNMVGPLEKYCKINTSEISPHSSTNFNIFSTHTIHKLIRSKKSSDKEVEDQESITLQNDGFSKKLKEIESQLVGSLDKESCRAILGNFRLGTANTVSYPISFDDLEMKRWRQDDGDTFKDKGTELIKMLNARDDMQSERSYSGSNNPGEIKRITPKTKLLIDTRLVQSLDMEFYDVSSTSSQESLNDPNEIFAPDTKNVQIDNNEENICCSCLRFLRLNR